MVHPLDLTGRTSVTFRSHLSLRSGIETNDTIYVLLRQDPNVFICGATLICTDKDAREFRVAITDDNNATIVNDVVIPADVYLDWLITFDGTTITLTIGGTLIGTYVPAAPFAVSAANAVLFSAYNFGVQSASRLRVQGIRIEAQ